MATQRYISTSFWDDPWVQGLDPSEKFVYLYLLTNPLTNIAGVYKITIRRITYDTGYNSETIERILARFKTDKKAILFGEYMILPAWPKHQKWDKKDTIRKGIEAELALLPKEVRKILKQVGYAYPMDSLPIPYAYRPCYSDSDSDSDIDSDTNNDTDNDAFAKKSAMKRIDEHINTWNGLGERMPKYRFTSLNMRESDRADFLRVLTAYSDADIDKAIRNYAEILQGTEYEAFPQYATFAGFITGGVEKYADDAKPFERCKSKKAPLTYTNARSDAWTEEEISEHREAVESAVPATEEEIAELERIKKKAAETPIGKAVIGMLGG